MEIANYLLTARFSWITKDTHYDSALLHGEQWPNLLAVSRINSCVCLCVIE